MKKDKTMTESAIRYIYLYGLSDDNMNYSIAEHKNTPPDILEQLGKKDDWLMQWTIAQNHNTPKKTLFQLAGSKFEEVRESAMWNLNQKNNAKR